MLASENCDFYVIGELFAKILVVEEGTGNVDRELSTDWIEGPTYYWSKNAQIMGHGMLVMYRCCLVAVEALQTLLSACFKIV